jgi:hypothetical protein
MRQETIEQLVKDLVTMYGDGVRSAQEGSQTFVRIHSVELYPTCTPPETPLLLVLDLGQQKPLVYVQPGQLLANGRVPRSSSTVLVGGESWMQFSFNIPWSEGDSIMRFVAAARQRFAQDD